MDYWSFYPSFALISVTFLLLWRTAIGRVLAVRRNQMDPSAVMFQDHSAMPTKLLLAGRSYDNQFQQPAMFYGLMLSCYLLQINELWLQWLAWGFVASRIWHCIEHLLAVNLLRRTLAFALASHIHLALWIVLAIKLLSIEASLN